MDFSNGLSFWQAFEGSSNSCCPTQIIPNASFQTFNNTPPPSLSWVSGLPSFNFTGIALGDTNPDASAVMVRREQCIQPSTCFLNVTYGFLCQKAQSGTQAYFEWLVTDTSGASILSPDTVRLGLDYNLPDDTLIQSNGDTLYFWGFNVYSIPLGPYNGQNLVHYARSIEASDSSAFSIGIITYECISCGGISCNISILTGGCNNDSIVQVGAGNFSSYLWSNGDTTATTSYALPLTQNIAVSVVDFSGATCSSQLNYIATTVQADFQLVDSCYNDFRIESLSSSTPLNIHQYYWDLGNGFINGNHFVQGSMPAPGNYNVQLAVQSLNGCWDTLSQNIYLPPITIPAFQSPVICGGEPYSLTTSNPTPNTQVRWIINGVNYGINDSLFFQNSAPGIYDVQLVYTDLLQSCSDTIDTSYTVYSRPAPLWSPMPPICENSDPFDLWSNVYSNLAGSIQMIHTAYNDQQYFYPSLAGVGVHPVLGTITTPIGCVDTIVGSIEVTKKPNVTSLGTVTTCAMADPFSLTPYVNSDTTGYFFFSHPAVSNDLFFPTLSGEGSFQVEAVQVNWLYGCTDTVFIPVQVEPIPDVSINPPDKLCIQQGLWVPPSGSPSGGWTESYYLQDSIFNPAYWGGGIYDFTYRVSDAWGCTGSASYQIEVLEDDCFCTLYLPNTFTPNGDSKNETFGPEWECDLTSYRFEIWNRWGELVFSTNNPFERWNGNDEVSFRIQDTYIYRLWYTGRYLDVNLEWINQEKYLEGEVFLLR